MNEFRKTIFAAIIISLFVGAAAGATGGIFAVQLAQTDGGGEFNEILPAFIRRLRNPSPPPLNLRGGENSVEGGDNGGNGNPLAPPSRPPVTEEEDATISVVRKVAPAVVSIAVYKTITPQNTGPLFPSELFREFGFEIEAPQVEQGPGQPQRRRVGGGSGFIITADGLVATNKHVVIDTEAEYVVIDADGKSYPAAVLARDPFIDFAILKIDAQDLPTVTLGNADKLRIGETVIAIGNALSEFSNTITKGVVSGINRRVTAGGSGIGTEVIEEAIQTDAAINPGNSGGPLINLRGEVVGVNTAVSRAGQLLGFAIPVNQIKPVIASVKEHGRIIRPWIGVRYLILNKDIAAENNFPVDYGALLVRGGQPAQAAVVPGSPADKSGLKENDIILEIDGVKITEEVSLARQIQKRKVGDGVTLKVLSQGQEREVKVVLEELK